MESPRVDVGSGVPPGVGAFIGMLFAAAWLAGCAGQRPPDEVTDDGLMRVPSRSEGGVYRNPDADFTRYRRIMLEPVSLEFARDWRKQHPEVTDAEIRRLQAEAIKSFREEFDEVLIDEGPYDPAETRDPDVLHVSPRVLDLDIPAPDIDVGRVRSYAPHPVRLQINGEVRDAATGELLMRVIMFDGQNRYPFDELRLANRSTNAHEMRSSFRKWSRLVREALDVAKVQPPNPGEGLGSRE